MMAQARDEIAGATRSNDAPVLPVQSSTVTGEPYPPLIPKHTRTTVRDSTWYDFSESRLGRRAPPRSSWPDEAKRSSGHPRLRTTGNKTWMAATSAAMTIGGGVHKPATERIPVSSAQE